MELTNKEREWNKIGYFAQHRVKRININILIP